MRILATVFMVMLVFSVGCQRPPPPPNPEEIAQDRAFQLAAAAANELVSALMPELQAAMKADGPAGALAVCADRAQQLTAEVEARYAEQGLRIRRTAQRVRNPLNAPDEWEQQWMDHAAASIGDTVSVTLRSIDEQGRVEIRYLRPLLLSEACLPCHGPAEQIDPAVRTLLDERYPDDEATGFQVGDFRGMISIRVPVKP